MPSISYNLNIPNPPNAPSADVTSMQANTNAINTIINVDHYTFGTNSPTINIDGLHKQVTLVNEAAPGLSTGSGVLYANSATGQSWPFWQNALNSFQLLGQNSLGTNGYVTLGGTLFQWGTNTAVSSGSFASGNATGSVTFATANIAFPTNCFSVFTIPFYNGTTGAPSGTGSVNISQAGTGALSKTQFTWTFNSNSSKYTGFYWYAVGN